MTETPDYEVVYVVQTALRDEAQWHIPGNALYEPSPGQLLDHVHHRIAKIAVGALRAAGHLAPE